jgi:hypothetical protein
MSKNNRRHAFSALAFQAPNRRFKPIFKSKRDSITARELHAFEGYFKKVIGIGPFFYNLIATWVPLRSAARPKLTNTNGARSCA